MVHNGSKNSAGKIKDTTKKKEFWILEDLVFADKNPSVCDQHYLSGLSSQCFSHKTLLLCCLSFVHNHQIN